MNIVDFTPHATVSWLEDLKAVRVEWLQLYMSLERFQEICRAALQLLKAHGGSIWVADQHKSIGTFDKNIHDFIVDKLGPIAEQNGITFIAVVMPKEAGLSSLSTKRWNKNTEEKGSIPTGQFETLEDCKKWFLKREEAMNDQT